MIVQGEKLWSLSNHDDREDDDVKQAQRGWNKSDRPGRFAHFSFGKFSRKNCNHQRSAWMIGTMI